MATIEIKNQESLNTCIRRCKENKIILPTLEQLAHPELIPKEIQEELKHIGLWDINPRNLFRISWKNEPKDFGGVHGDVNYIEIPHQITGVKARIFMLVGKFFPTGAHKVGAAYLPMAGRMVSGEFNTETQKAVWPSTGNYCRGGAYISRLLGGVPIAILPQNMSKERFEWLHKVGAEVHATPGCESNVKEVFDKAHELDVTGKGKNVVLNQFCEFNNPMFHYYCTGSAMMEVFEKQNAKTPGLRFAGIHLTQGSAGTLASADYVREKVPTVKVAMGESLQCPTLLWNGYGDHRIEGIGDKHVPWILNIKNMDCVVDIDDDHCMRLIRLFNEPAGQEALKKRGVPAEFFAKLPLIGISGIANMLGCIKLAKWYEWTEKDCVFSVCTDSMDLYKSRCHELTEQYGAYTVEQGLIDYELCLKGQTTAYMQELDYPSKKRIHNLKYFTWIEQQGKELAELNAQWYDENYWHEKWAKIPVYNKLIKEFNAKVAKL